MINHYHCKKNPTSGSNLPFVKIALPSAILKNWLHFFSGSTNVLYQVTRPESQMVQPISLFHSTVTVSIWTLVHTQGACIQLKGISYYPPCSHTWGEGKLVSTSKIKISVETSTHLEEKSAHFYVEL